jgi:preprotein translocase subunit SecE
MKEKILLSLTALVVVIGVGAYYYFDTLDGAARFGVLLGALIVAVIVFYQSAAGKATWEFTKGARQEMRKVVWPNQKETAQVTLIVFVMAVLIAIFLWLVDMGLGKTVQLITT